MQSQSLQIDTLTPQAFNSRLMNIMLLLVGAVGLGVFAAVLAILLAVLPVSAVGWLVITFASLGSKKVELADCSRGKRLAKRNKPTL
jgi:hypothetical protein